MDHLPRHLVERLQIILRERYDCDLSYEEAEEAASALLRLFRLMTRLQ